MRNAFAANVEAREAWVVASMNKIIFELRLGGIERWGLWSLRSLTELSIEEVGKYRCFTPFVGIMYIVIREKKLKHYAHFFLRNGFLILIEIFCRKKFYNISRSDTSFIHFQSWFDRPTPVDRSKKQLLMASILPTAICLKVYVVFRQRTFEQLFESIIPCNCINICLIT